MEADPRRPHCYSLLLTFDDAVLFRVERDGQDLKTDWVDLGDLHNGLVALEWLARMSAEEVGRAHIPAEAVAVLGTGATSVVYELKGW